MRIRRGADGRNGIVTASFGPGGGIASGRNEAGASQSTAYLLGADLRSSLLEGVFDVEAKHELQATYRDIYYHDAICGSAVDIQATMPWSDFTLTGADDEHLDVFRSTMEKLNVRSLHELISKDRLVSGAFVAALVYDEDQSGHKGFSDMISFDYADCDVLPVPLMSQDPVLRLTISDALREFANSSVEELQAIMKSVPDTMLEHFRNSKQVMLDPLSTVYLPRASLSTVQSGVSYYRRVLPCYLLERVLYRGTITAATKRQRSLTHVTVGNTEDWSPTDADIEFAVSLFQVAESDPLNAIVATRDNVNVSEVLSHSDIWSWNETSDQLREIKMQALGISDSFVSAEGTFDTAQTAISVFIESMRSFREQFTQKFYYEKLFPLLALANDLSADKRKETAAGDKDKAQKLLDIKDKLNDTENLLIPEIQWHKQLRPSGDQDYLERLNVLQEKGLPIPLSVWAAAAGVNLTQIVGELDDDARIRQDLEQYKPKREEGGDEFASEKKGEEGGEGEDGGRSLMHNVFQREYAEEDMEIPSRTRTGKPRWNPNQKGARKRINERAAKALDSLSDPNEFADALKRSGGMR